MNTIKTIILFLYSTVSALIIYFLSAHEYEWMIGEDAEVNNICELPLQDGQIIFAVLALLPVLALAGYGAYTKKLKTILLSLALFLFWIWRFYIRTLLC